MQIKFAYKILIIILPINGLMDWMAGGWEKPLARNPLGLFISRKISPS